MDVHNPVIQLCLQGTQAEFAGNPGAAHALYRQAWETARDDFEACIAAHYLARFQASRADTLHWNQEALRRAQEASPDQVREFFPSLYLNLARSYELTGHPAEAHKYYAWAAELGYPHQEPPPGE